MEKMKLVKSVVGQKPSEQMGSLGIVGSVVYGVVTGDLFGAALGAVGGLALRFKDEVNSVIDFGDKQIHVNDVLESAKKAEKCIQHACLRPEVTRLDPALDKVKERIGEAMQRQAQGSVLSEDEKALLLMAQYIGS